MVSVALTCAPITMNAVCPKLSAPELPENAASAMTPTRIVIMFVTVFVTATDPKTTAARATRQIKALSPAAFAHPRLVTHRLTNIPMEFLRFAEPSKDRAKKIVNSFIMDLT
jgi:hypothetical protein